MDSLADITRFGELSTLELKSSMMLLKRNFRRTLLLDAEAGMNLENVFFSHAKNNISTIHSGFGILEQRSSKMSFDEPRAAIIMYRQRTLAKVQRKLCLTSTLV